MMRNVYEERLEELKKTDEAEITDEDIQKLNDLLDGATVFVYDNSEILNIIREEAGAFLEEQKSAEEAAAIIQDRVSIYLSERKQ